MTPPSSSTSELASQNLPSDRTPTILHESEGLTIRRNAINQFCVVSLYFWADPAKRSEEWKKESQAGMHPAKWRKEYMIDYDALSGEVVFPEFTQHRDKIVLMPPYPEFPSDQPFWGGFDLGQRNVSSFHVYTLYDGVIYVLWELYEPCRNIIEFSNKLRSCPYWTRIRYIAADPSIWADRQYNQKTGVQMSVYDFFVEQNITKMIKGNTDEGSWLMAMRKHWADASNITFRIQSNCPNMIREFRQAVYPTVSEIVEKRANFVEKILDKNNHAMDDCKYFLNSRPSGAPRKFTIKNIADSYHFGR